MTYVVQDQMTREIRNLLVETSDDPCGTKNAAATLSKIQKWRGIVSKPILGLRGHEKAIRQALWKSEQPKNRFSGTSGKQSGGKNVWKPGLEIRGIGKPFRKRL